VSDDGPSPKQVAKALAGLGDSFWAIVRFARNPFGFVAGIISTYVVGTILYFGRFLAGSILAPFRIAADSLGLVTNRAVLGLSAVTNPLFGLIATVQGILITVVQAAGPAGPILIGLAAGAVVYLSVRLLISLAGEVPVGSSLVDFLRLR